MIRYRIEVLTVGRVPCQTPMPTAAGLPVKVITRCTRIGSNLKFRQVLPGTAHSERSPAHRITAGV